MRRPAPLPPNRRPYLVAAAVCFGVVGIVGSASSQVGSTPGRAANPGDSMGQVILWCGVLLLAAVVLGVAFFLIRKRLASMDDESPAVGNPLGFTLADLRQMHAEGQLSDEEFDFAKRKMVAKAKAELDGPAAADEDPELIDLGDADEDRPDTDEPRS
ncbi:MAG: SHOCT domain-containing protein [Planctomycetota bacterium]